MAAASSRARTVDPRSSHISEMVAIPGGRSASPAGIYTEILTKGDLRRIEKIDNNILKNLTKSLKNLTKVLKKLTKTLKNVTKTLKNLTKTLKNLTILI